MRTYQARLDCDDAALLDEYGDRFGRALRALHATRQAQRAVAKMDFAHRFDLTGRQYNALRFTLDGMYASLRELRPVHVERLAESIKAVVAKIAGESKREIPRHTKLHNLNRRLGTLRDRKANLQRETVPHLCFGSSRLFSAQHHLAENLFSDHAEWKASWSARRSRQFFVLGSKDETAGCQGCVMTHLGSDRFYLRLRLPNGLSKKYVEMEVRFKHGADHLLGALALGQAVSYRFLRDERGWRVFASTAALEKPCVSDDCMGVLSVDLNVDHVAWAETDRFGNLLKSGRIALCTYGLSRDQAKTAVAEVVKLIVGMACALGKPLACESLDFRRKKARLKYSSPKTCRRLSSFAYRAFAALLNARAFDTGVEMRAVNPAFTSKIGKQKYARPLGISVHQAAALVIARIAQRFSDTYVARNGRRFVTTCKDRNGHVPVLSDAAGTGEKAEVVPPTSSVLPQGRDGPGTRALRSNERGVTALAIQRCGPGGIPGSESSATRVRPALLSAEIPVEFTTMDLGTVKI